MCSDRSSCPPLLGSGTVQGLLFWGLNQMCWDGACRVVFPPPFSLFLPHFSRRSWISVYTGCRKLEQMAFSSSSGEKKSFFWVFYDGFSASPGMGTFWLPCCWTRSFVCGGMEHGLPVRCVPSGNSGFHCVVRSLTCQQPDVTSVQSINFL